MCDPLLPPDISDNPEIKWLGQAREFEKLFKENVHIVSFGASLPEPTATALLGGFVRAPGRMRRISLTRAPLHQSHVNQLYSVLTSKQSALTDLDLTYSYIEDKGAARLAKALHTNRSLTRLCLAHNGVAGMGGAAVAEALCINPTSEKNPRALERLSL